MENRRRVLFIDRKFQLDLILKTYGFFCFLFLTFLLVTYVLILPLLTELSFLSLPPDHAISLIIQNFKIYALIIGVLSFFGLSCFVIMATLLISHKIAGPVYSLRRTMKEIIEEKELKDVCFREKDLFMNLQEQFNQLIAFLKSK